MRRTILYAALIVVLSTSSYAVIPRDPDFSLRWNQFSSVISIDSFVIATAKDGIMVFDHSATSLSLQPVTQMFLDVVPVRQYRFGSILMVQTVVNTLYFFDLSSLPTITSLGEIDLETPFNDLALRGDDLYVSRGYDGLFRYRLNGYNNATLLDSSIIGIHYRQIQLSGDSILALDDYNGMMIYRITGTAFPDFEGYLYLPFQATSFIRRDSLLMLAVDSNVSYLARLRGNQFVMTDTFDLLTVPLKMMSRGETFLFFDSSRSFAEILDPIDKRQGFSQLLDPPDSSLFGDITSFGARSYVTFALDNGGIGFYDVDSLWSYAPRPVLGIPQEGNVTSLKMVNGKMFIGASHNPVDEYAIGSGGQPTYERTLYSALDLVSGMDLSGDSLFISYPQIRRSIVLEVGADSNTYRGAFYLDTMQYYSLRFNSSKIDTLRSAFAIGQSRVGMFAVNDSGFVSTGGTLDVIGRIRDIELADSVVAVLTGKGVWLFRVFDDFTGEYRATVDLGADCFELVHFGSDLATFSGRVFMRLRVDDPFNPQVDTLLTLPWGINSATQVGRLIYAVGEEGICVIDASVDPPVLLDSGGRGGSLIASMDGIVAVSDSERVHIYDLSRYPTPVRENHPGIPTGFALDQNYPNPFNPSTTISYSVPSRTRVELSIYNLLGQRVTTLVDAVQGAGQYRVEWDGRSSDGRGLATGIYFYLIRAGNFSASKKMILLK